MAVPYECAQVSFRLGNVDMPLVNRTQLADLLAQVVSVESLCTGWRRRDSRGIRRNM
jgi:hypothetical protein